MKKDEKEENLYGISTNFIRKIYDFFIMIIGETSFSNIPLKKMHFFEIF